MANENVWQPAVTFPKYKANLKVTPTLLDALDAVGTFTPTACTIAVDAVYKQGVGAIKLTATSSNTCWAVDTVAGSYDPHVIGTVAMLVNVQSPPTDISNVGLAIYISGIGQTVQWSTTGIRQGWRWVSADMQSDYPTVYAAATGSLRKQILAGYPSGKTPTVTYDSIVYNAKGRPTFVFTFDDAFVETYNNVYPIMASRGFLGTCYIPPGYIGLNNTRLSLSQIQSLYASGWDMGVDSWLDLPWSDASYPSTTACVQDLQAIRTYLASNGMPRAVDHLCWPNNSWTETLCTAFSNVGMKSGRTTFGYSFYDTFGLGDIAMTVNGLATGSGATYAALKAQVDTAIARGETLIFYSHDVSATPSGIGTSTSIFTQLVDYIKTFVDAGTADVSTITQWYDKVKYASQPIA